MKRKGIILLFLCVLCATAAAVTTTINAFNAGELSPLLEGRTDIAKYYSGCRTLENFLVLSYGGVTKRPGSEYIASAKAADEAVRLIPFEFSIAQAYILELGDEYIRFYRNGGQILDSGSPYEISSPYDTDAGTDLFDIQFVQSADTMYLVHPDYAVRQLTRTDHTAWTLTATTFKRGPFLAENETAVTITPSATTGSITLTASSATFNANHVGALWQVTHTAAAVNESGSFSNDGSAQNSSNVTVQLGRKFDFTTHGTWAGDLSLQKSFDSGVTWKDVIPVHYESDGNIQFSDTETANDAIYRVHAEAGAAGIDSGTVTFNLTARSFDVNGVVTITAFTNTSLVTGTVTNTLGGTTATAFWNEGAWSADEGYPNTVCFFEERLCFGGTTNSPQTIWLSRTDDWPNFLAGTLDTSALQYSLSANQVNAIRWLAPQNAILIGTSGGEWRFGASNNDPLNFENRQAHRQSTYGSAFIQSVMVNNVVLYAQRQAKKVRELAFSFELDNWVSPDMTVLSEHITGDGIVQFAFQKTPDPILWCVTVDGELAALTYNREQEVVAWHLHTTEGDYESVAVIPGDGEDEVWVSVERTIDSATVRYVEQFQPRDFGDDVEDAFFVDSGLSFDGGAAITVTDITKASPAVVTTGGHSFTDGEQVKFSSVGGMTEVNGRVYTVSDEDATTFKLRDSTDAVDIDSTGFTAYTTGGSVLQVENNFTTLTHLEGEEVQVQVDGGFLGTETVSSATITLDNFYNTVHAGLAYNSRLLPQRLNVPGTNLQGLTKRVVELTIRFHDTQACKVGDSWDDFEPIVFRRTDDPAGAAVPLRGVEDKRHEFDADYETDGNIYIQSDSPLPITVLAIFPEFEGEGFALLDTLRNNRATAPISFASIAGICFLVSKRKRKS